MVVPAVCEFHIGTRSGVVFCEIEMGRVMPMVGELPPVLFEIAEATAAVEVADADEAAVKKLSALEAAIA